MQLPIALTSPPRKRLTIEKGTYAKGVVRIFFTDEAGRRSCLDSKLMTKTACVKMARRIAETGAEVEVVAFKHNCVRPHPWQVHKVRRLDEVRLNRVSGLVSAATMLELRTVLMGDEADEA